MSSSLRLVPLGGLGEIGMNCMALEADDAIVVVDCGVMFPFRELGVDIIHPELSWLLERRDRIAGVVLTHGHEDHVGAVPYLLRQAAVPVWGPPYALAMVRHRMREVCPDAEADLRPTAPRTPFEVGPVHVEPIRVTHSIPDATALALSTPLGTIVHSGDFNIDEAPLGDQRFDADRFRELGDAGVRLLLADSTNIGVAGDSGRERDVAAVLADRVARARARVVISLFASNVHRVQSAIEAARAARRKVCLLGRSVQTHTRIASELGWLKDPSAVLVPPDRARDVPRGELLVIATGTQGEPPAALSRLARGAHPDLDLEEGDQVILSSRIIPGHEQTVFGMVNELERRGVEVCHRGIDPGIHVSGHACRDEQRTLLELVRPRAFMPVHGTYHHLRRHAALARETGVAQTLIVEDGSVVDVDDEGQRVVGRAPVGRVHVDAGEAVPEIVLRDRALLAELGIALVIVQVDGQGRLASPPEIVTRGVLHEEQEPELLADARQYVADEVASCSTPRLGFDEAELREQARRALSRYMRRRLGRKPLTYATVVKLP